MTPSHGAGGPSERDDRDRFDAWWDSQPHLHDIGATEYRHHARATAWAAWQARASLASPPPSSAVVLAARALLEHALWDHESSLATVDYCDLDALRAALATAPTLDTRVLPKEIEEAIRDLDLEVAGMEHPSIALLGLDDLRAAILAHLPAASGMDARTVEVCAKVCDERAEFSRRKMEAYPDQHDWWRARWDVSTNLAAAIRALASPSKPERWEG